MANIVVIGSANIDTTNYLEGEFPDKFTSECSNRIKESKQVLGGKGANQAVSTKKQSRKNDTVFFVGCVGKDSAGEKVRCNLEQLGIDDSGVKVIDGKATDGRIIAVDQKGNYRMVGYGDCITELTPGMMLEKKEIQVILANADIVMIQMKMPPETVEVIFDYCQKNGKKILIDPTPPDKSLPLVTKGLIGNSTFLTPNEEEAYALSKYLQGYTDFNKITKLFELTTPEERLKEIKELIKRYPNIIATLGDKGVIYNNGQTLVMKKPYPTKCKDSTGAGDTFNGAFIAAIARGASLEEAIDYAVMASSIKVGFKGAQNGIPSYEETEIALNRFKGTRDD